MQDRPARPLYLCTVSLRNHISALARYHEFTWQAGYLEKFSALVEVGRKVMKHRAEKPDSKRRLALLRLGSQVEVVLHRSVVMDGA